MSFMANPIVMVTAVGTIGPAGVMGTVEVVTELRLTVHSWLPWLAYLF